MDLIFAIAVFVVILGIEIMVPRLANSLNSPFLKKVKALEQSMASKIMVAFLAGFSIYVIFTDRVANPGQKIPIIIAALLIIWANLFLTIKHNPDSEKNHHKEE